MSCIFETNQAVVDKIREMGFTTKKTEVPHVIHCQCGTNFVMETCLCECPKCYKTYAVTPCSSADANSIVTI